MLEKMAGEAISNSFTQNSTAAGSNPPPIKKKRNLPGTPDPEAEVIALSPKTLMATNRFLCEICGKGFQRDQNLQLHRRGHNLPWKLKQRTSKEPRKRVYVCPEKSCVHHHPLRALGDLTGIKKHFCRKHGEKKWKCEKCSKKYAVQSDWKAHSKTCGTREYRCDCGTLFSRRDSFITHRAFCDALAEETARATAASNVINATTGNFNYHLMGTSLGPSMVQHFSSILKPLSSNEAAIEQPRPGLSLWMGQGSQVNKALSNNLPELHHMGSASTTATLYSDPFISCSNPLQSEYQFNWVYGSNKLSSTNAGALTSTSLPLSNVKEVSSPQLASAPCLYSFQHQHDHQLPTANMSATALLQKAAQIGATSTDPSFFGTFGVKCNNTQVEDESKYNGLFSPNPTPKMGTDLDGGSMNSLSTLENHLQMYPRKRPNTQDDTGGQTRDFLGVGVQTICPSSINGWI
ncbi:zinc finger protein MAGPIE-like [Macadamia integrifolia]|uniref:zinc finger protein MAGPIE-like n=1 Tax=Macadamia integrifolia TaxID=60698 RepID=UPI001C4F9365|nr:zinc finger protein MAGPIE-like [Macadamia integrifolia]